MEPTVEPTMTGVGAGPPSSSDEALCEAAVPMAAAGVVVVEVAYPPAAPPFVFP